VHDSSLPLATALYWLVTSSLKGTVLIGLVVIVRRFLDAATAARLRYVLWLPVLIGLLCPIGPAVQLDGVSYLAGARPFAPRAEPTSPQPHRASAGVMIAGTTDEVTHTGNTEVASGRTAHPSGDPVDHAARANRSTVLAWIAMVWIGVAAILGFAYLGNLFKYWRIRRRADSADQAVAAAVERCRTELGLRRKVLALESAELDSPTIFGWWRPRLLLPTGLHRRIGSSALRHVILHELAHVKEHDVFVHWLGAATQMLHWFNPAVWLAMRCMRRDMEQACDARVLPHLTATERTDYGSMLVQLSDSNAAETLPTYGLGIADRHSDLKERLIMISSFSPTPNTAKLIAGLALAGFTSAALTQPSLAPAGQVPPQAMPQAENSPAAPPTERTLRLADTNPAARAPDESRANGVPMEKLVAQVAANIHRRVILDPRASSSVILYGQKLDQIDYSDFLTILRINGLTAVDINDYINVVPVVEVRWLPLPVMSANKELPPDQFADMSIVLKNACAPSLVPILRPELPNYAHLVADVNSNSIIAIDTYANLKRIRAQITELDSRTKPGVRCGGGAR
jgi:beta-lactamase regulating signal transducer with metallopeptidase domain